MRGQRLLLLLLVFCPLLLATVPMRSPLAFAPLDGGQAAVQGVHVLAMAISPDGTLYAGGRHTQTLHAAGQPSLAEVGSVFMVSHDHGAHWTKRVSDEPPPGVLTRLSPWTDHTRWPNNFTVYQLVVDASHPTTIYAAGGFPFSRGDRGQPHLLLRSTDGGRTWTEILMHRVNLNATPPLVTNILVTSTNRQDLTYRRAHNAQTLVIDPRNPRHLYLGTDELGVLRSTDGGATWQYNPASPSIAPHVSEQLLLDPQPPTTLYVLIQDTTMAFLYRSEDSGTTWQRLWQGDYASGLFLEGHTLYVARWDGIYASVDRGRQWSLAVNARTLPGFTRKTVATLTGIAGRLDQALLDRWRGNAWYVEMESYLSDHVHGLYATTNAGATWSLVTDGRRGAQGALSGAVAFNGNPPGLWLDDGTQPRILFSASAVDGLYRWRVIP